jgi:hypothetical protein
VFKSGEAEELGKAKARARFYIAFMPLYALGLMERFYHKGACSFEDVISHNGAGALLSILGFGVKARDEMMEKVKAGDFTMSESPEHV